MLKYFSMFSGIGGFELGIQQAYETKKDIELPQSFDGQQVGVMGHDGDKPDSERSLRDGGRTQPVCIGYSEIDKYAIQIYERHFNHKNYGDATTISPTTLPDFDLLVGGFPCQAFSIAGKRGGFDDTRGTLFFDIARILKEKRPRHFILENVKGLLSHDNGRTFKTIITTLAELGYGVEWQVLNSKNFGVPQNRERVFIIGHLGTCCGRQVFPIRANDGLFDSTNESEESQPQTKPASTIRTKQGGRADDNFVAVATLRTFKDGQGFRATKEQIAPTLQARAREDGSGQAVILQKPRGFNKGGIHKIAPTIGSNSWQQNNHLAIPVLTPDRANKKQNGKRFKENNDPSFTLTTNDQHGIYDGAKIRRLTPIECERLQGFPDGWTEFGKEGICPMGIKPEECNHPPVKISDTQRYKVLGNAVTVNVIEYLIKKLYA